MSAPHRIDTVTLDFAFDSENTAFAQLPELGTDVWQRLLAVIDDVFDEVSGSTVVYRFDALELDLGAFPEHGYSEVLAERLRHSLRTWLQTHLPAGEAQPVTGLSVVGQAHAEFEQLAYFLDHGRLPWNTGRADPRTLAHYAQRVLDHSGPALVAALKKKLLTRGPGAPADLPRSFRIAG